MSPWGTLARFAAVVLAGRHFYFQAPLSPLLPLSDERPLFTNPKKPKTMALTDLSAHLDYGYYLQNQAPQTVYLYLSFSGSDSPQSEKRVPLNISLVLDRSGSMAGEPLAYVKKASQFVVQQLNSSDYLSIVQYDDAVDVVSPSGLVQQPERIKQLIERISAGGTTNLSGGMLKGYEQVATSQQEQYINRVLLLSDGLANEGITDPAALQEIAKKHFREKGIGLSTFGVGSNFNERLMQQLSEYGGGNYHFIASPDGIPQIFEKELEGLLSVVAQQVQVKVQYDAEQLQCSKVYGYPAEQQAGLVSIPFNDVFAQEEKTLLLAFEVKGKLSGNLSFELALDYFDAIALEKRQQQKIEWLKSTAHREKVTRSAHPKTLEEIAVFTANERFDAITTLVDQQQYEKAEKLLSALRVHIDKNLQAFPHSALLQRMKELVDNYRIDRIQQLSQNDYQQFQKASRSMNYMAKRRK